MVSVTVGPLVDTVSGALICESAVFDLRSLPVCGLLPFGGSDEVRITSLPDGGADGVTEDCTARFVFVWVASSEEQLRRSNERTAMTNRCICL